MTRHIVAGSAGMVATARGDTVRQPGPVLEFALALAGARRPRICYVGTAGGDAAHQILAFHAAFAGREDVVASHLALFPMPNVVDPHQHLLAQDVIWVGGGSVINLLAVWRAHGLAQTMSAAWERGVVLGGVSAGSICWHAGGVTDSFGLDLAPITEGLALLPYGNGVHYDSEVQRRPALHALVAAGAFPSAYATDDGVALHYAGTELVEAVSARAGASAYHVERTSEGGVRETVIEPRLLEARLLNCARDER